MECKTRSVVKAALWTILGFAVMMVVGFFATGSWGLGGTMAVVNSGIGMISYVLYERLWARIRWGLVQDG